MAYFLSSYCDVHWDIYCNILKKPNEFTGYSGFISQHMIPEYYCMKTDLENMKNSFAALEGFSSYNSRRNLHAGDECKIMHEQLPNLFFNDALTLLKKYFDQ